MFLYHGTSQSALENILLNQAITPRGARQGNWKESPSRKDRIYLTTTYAPYFAAAAAQENDTHFILLEIDDDFLFEENLYPDEDFVAQATYPKDSNIDIHAYTNSLDMEGYKHHAQDSLKHLGNIAYKGEIPLDAITRIAFVERNSRVLSDVLDPCVTITHHQVLGDKYGAFTTWLFDGGDVPSMNFDDAFLACEIPDGPEGDVYRAFRNQLEVRKNFYMEQRESMVRIVDAQEYFQSHQSCHERSA